MKKLALLLSFLLLPMALLSACGQEDLPDFEDRVVVKESLVTSYEGVVRKLEKIDVYQSGTHQLITEDEEMIILQSPTIDMSRYLDENVVVKGSMKKGDGELKDVFTVTSISYIDETASQESETYENKLFGFHFDRPAAWTTAARQDGVALKFEEKTIADIGVFSDKIDLTGFAKSKEEGTPTEVTIGSQKALRYSEGDRLIFYVPNPPKKKIYRMVFTPTINSVDDSGGVELQRELFYNLLDSFQLMFISQASGEKCGGPEAVACTEGQICQLKSDEKDAEGVCMSVGASSTDTASCPFIAPPTTCNEYRISEYSLKGCPTRYECVTGEDGKESASYRDLNTVDAGKKPEDYEEEPKENQPESSSADKIDESDDADEVSAEKTYSVPDISDVTATYKSDRKGFTMLYPKKWYYASFGSVDGNTWKVGFADHSFENTEEALVMLSIGKTSGGTLSRKIGDDYYTLAGPSDLTEVMEKMLGSIQGI